MIWVEVSSVRPIGVVFIKIDISDAIRNEGEIKSCVYDGPLQGIDFMGEHFCFPVIHVRAEYRYDGVGIIIDGDFSADVEVNCSRCLKPFTYPMAFEFSEYYKKEAQEEDGVYAYLSDIIDLSRMLQDNVALIMPMKFLCREDCRGLCGICGSDLNEGSCNCRGSDKEGPLSGLPKLNNDEEV